MNVARCKRSLHPGCVQLYLSVGLPGPLEPSSAGCKASTAVQTLGCTITGCAGSWAPPNTLKNLREAAWPSYTPASAQTCHCRESGSSIKLFKNFRESNSIRTPFTIEGIHGGALLAVRGHDFVAFYDWGTAEVRGCKPGCPPTFPPHALGWEGSCIRPIVVALATAPRSDSAVCFPRPPQPRSWHLPVPTGPLWNSRTCHQT